MSEHVRRVASPEGAQYYGLPIGAPITADAKAKAKALHGGSEPAGASKGGFNNKGGNASAATNAKAAMEKAASATPVKPKPTKNKVKKSSISGNLHFKVGKTDYTAPNGSKLFHQKGVDGLAYVKTPDGKVHIFNENGEIETDSTAVLQALSQKFSADLPTDDPDFESVDFDKVGSHYGIDQMPVGGVLTDSRGNPVFSKNEDGTWHNEELGVDLDEKAVKPLFDSGDLIPEKTPTSEAVSNALADKEAVNFSELSMPEAVTALDEMPEGTALQAGELVFTKEAGGWSSDGGDPLPSSTIAYVKNELKPADGVDVTPAMAEDPKGAPAPKSTVPDPTAPPAPTPEVTDRAAASKQAIADSNPNKPQPVNWETTYPADVDYPKEANKPSDVATTEPGDTVLAAYYPEPDEDGEEPSLNDYYDIAVFTKQDDGTWWDQDSIQKLSQEDMESLVKDPAVGVYPNKNNTGPEIARAKAKAAQKKAQEDALKKELEAPSVGKLDGSGLKDKKDLPKMVTGGHINVPLNDLEIGHKVALKFKGQPGKSLASKTVYTKIGPDTWSQDGDPTSFGDKSSQWLQGQKNKSTTLVNEAYPEAVPETAPKSWESLQPGDTATGEWSKNVGMGSKVAISQKGVEGTYTKSSVGTWTGGGFSFTDDQMSYALDKIGTAGTGEDASASVVSTQKKASLKSSSPVDAPAAPEDLAVPSNDPTAVGGKPETIEHLKSYPEGTTLLYATKGGDKTSYVKLGSGDYLSPGGQVLAPEKLKNSVVQGKFEVGNLPAQTAPDVDGLDSKYLTSGGNVDKFGVLKQYPVGTVLSANGMGEFNPSGGLKLTKQEDGSWLDQFEGVYTPAEFEDDIQKERLFFQSAPKSSVDANSADAPDVHSTTKSITFDNSGQSFSAAELKEAHDALENFSGPQINYGLKSVPDNVFAGDKDMQTKLKAWGKTAYPTLPPKQAAINVLKDKLGLKKDAPVAEQKNSDAPEISFGSTGADIKTTATGFTGGSYSAEDVQSAIDILEGFQGKNFKSELNKKNNPLGQLSPNDLVGFNKDKTVTKQKFIDLMKQKLETHKSEQADVPQQAEPNLLPDPEPLADWEKALLYPDTTPAEINEMAEAGPSVGTVADHYSTAEMPLGTVLISSTGKKFTKVAPNVWDAEGMSFKYNDAGVKFAYSKYFYDHLPTAEESAQMQKDFDSVQEGGEVPSTPSAFPYKNGDYLPSSEGASMYNAAPVGTTIQESVEDGFEQPINYTKQDNGEWMADTAAQDVLSSKDLASFAPDSGYLVLGRNVDHANAPTSAELAAASVDGPKAGEQIKSKVQLDAQPAGTKIENKSGYEFTKTPEGDWDSEDAIYTTSEIADAHVLEDMDYHFTFVPSSDGAVSTEDHLTEADIEGASVGDVVTFHNAAGGTFDYKKVGDNAWIVADDPSADLDESALMDAFGYSGSHFTWASKSNPLPIHADAPNAVKSKDHDAASLNAASVDNAPVGKVYANIDGSIMYVKQGDDNWSAYDKQSGAVEFYSADKSIKQGLDAGDITEVPYDGPEYNKSGLMPGKYSSGAAAYMVVHADGTGTYVNGKGVASKLTSYKVKKNHESGMSYYQGIPNEVPAVESDPKSGPKSKPAKLGKADIPDGTYFLGNPNNEKTSLYHVEGDKITVQKSIAGVPGSKKKVGQDADITWLKNAPEGAQIEGQVDFYGWKAGKVYTKGSDGWKTEEGDTLDVNTMAGYEAAYGTIVSHGLVQPEEITAAKLQNLAKKGELTDKYGNSITPAGYTGEVYFLGSKTTIPTLAYISKEWEKNPDLNGTDLKPMGLHIPANNSAKAYIADNFGEYSATNNIAAVKKNIADMLQNVDTDLPEADAADLFEYNALGQPVAPAKMNEYAGTSVTSKRKFIKEIGAEFGGGGIIGQHTDGMDSYEASQWIEALRKGDFKKMYDLEVSGATTKSTSHIAGYKHPGFSGNEATNKIAWAPAVEGEVPAGEKVPGDWTSTLGVAPSMPEVDNYLIVAQMQNPTYLSDNEKRNWYSYHKSGNQSAVDNLSLVAKNRKDNGHAELSDMPTWSDDIKPAKSYDSMFENKVKYPTGWLLSQANDYFGDHAAELQPAYDAWVAEDPNYHYAKKDFINQHFQKLADAEAAEALIPVYTKDPQQTVKKSTHPIFNYHDQHGNKYYFKPRPDTKEDKYRTEVEHLGNSLGGSLGFKTAKSKLMTLDGQYGQMQNDVGGVADFSGFDFKTLTPKQIVDIEGEHLLDYFMNNDDAKYDNAKFLQDGSVVGIDKARAFSFYGQWDWEGSAADGNTTIYQNMYSAIRSGAFSKEDLDKAYLKARKHAVRISKFDEGRLRDMMTEGMQNRTTYNVPYTIDGKQVSQDFDGLMAAVMDRKAKLPDIFDEKWKALYADAKMGDLPEQGAYGPEGLITGLDSADAHENMFKAKAAGITTQLAGGHVIGGTAHLWTDQYADGSTNMHGEMYLGPKMQEKLNSYFTANASDMSASKAQVAGFEGINNSIDAKYLSAVKTINAHIEDGSYNGSTIDAFNEQVKTLQEDADEWNPSLESNTSQGGFPAYTFKSGTTVAMEHLDQYKMAADSYLEKAPTIQEAYTNKTATGQYTPYVPVKVDKKASFYTKPDGSVATPLQGVAGQFLIKDATTGGVSQGKLDGDWSEYTPDTKTGLLGDTGIKVTKRSFTHETSASWANGVKTSKPGATGVTGSAGTEWEIELPTGEKIHYRNSGLTNTAQAQHGKLVFSAEGVQDESASQAAMNNIMSQLNTLGISTEAQTDTDAELTYWREMYGILASRNHTKQSDKRYEAAEKDMWAKQKEIGGNKDHFLETLDEKMSPDEQAQFWRDLWAKHFGQEKVNDLIENQKYLPEFAHQDYSQPDLATGKPHFYRFDVDMDALMKNDWMLATSTGGDPWDRFRSGGLLGAEERMRQLNLFMGAKGGYGTALQDQQNGGSHYIYTRLTKQNNATGYNVIYSPRTLLKTRTASFSGDVYGNVNKRKTGAPSDPLHVTEGNSNWMGGSNETDIPHSATLLDDVEILAFDNAAKLNEAIQELKKAGIESIRGIPIEERLVMHEKMAEAIAKMKARWAEGVY